MKASDQHHVPAALLPKKKSIDKFCTRGCVSPRVSLDGYGEESLLTTPEFDPRTVQPLASRYADWAILPHGIQILSPY
jgi:hypothetical protein